MIKSYLFLLTVFTISLCLISRIDSFDPSSVSADEKKGWCTEQTAVCDNYCKDNGTTGATTNTCDYDKLTYSCVCADGKSPDPSLYTMPVDYFKCSSDQQNCTAKCGAANPDCVKACTGNCAATLSKYYDTCNHYKISRAEKRNTKKNKSLNDSDLEQAFIKIISIQKISNYIANAIDDLNDHAELSLTFCV
ncbi:15729_t:CDS:2 [Dentiscutata heterogama]|uniref:15729_t:CDS:1 n=1 Tax=Dentiscutata heterogama TaxID=1316150 RepID=A0ACA9LB16_9GLOM|nr:15729_t:CDS:2 [Dentiscutata heterogama]